MIDKILQWKERYLNDQQFMLILSALVGASVGAGAVVIKNLVHYIESWVSSVIENHGTFWFIVSPSIGILLVILFINHVIRKNVQHGIPGVLFSISKNNGRIRKHNLYSSVISSVLTVGFGGSVGLEGPTVATGAAMGSTYGHMFQLKYKQVVLLLGCACAGALASIFKAPVAAIVFAVEVIMLDLTMAAIIPLLTASVSAALVSYMFLGQDVIYSFEIQEKFQLSQIHWFVVLGIITGFVSIYFSKVYKGIEHLFSRIQNVYVRLLAGGSLLGLLVFIIPSLYGEGYQIINDSLHGDFSYLFKNTIYESFQSNTIAIGLVFLGTILFKVIATSVTFGAGGIGGIFAPSLFLGAITGVFFAFSMGNFGIELNVSNFALVGMAGLIAGVIHAPLTSIFLIAEITGGYDLFMPLMIVAGVSYGTVRLFEQNSVYTFQLAQRGELITHHKDKAVLMRLKLYDLIEKDFNVVHPKQTLGELVKVITKAHRNIFPVIENDGTFRGIVKLDDIRHIMFKPELYDEVLVENLMHMPAWNINPDDSIEKIAQVFQNSDRFNITVVKNKKYIGFISRARMFSAYRQELSDSSEH